MKLLKADPKVELVLKLLDNGINAYLKEAGEKASLEGFFRHVKEVATMTKKS